MVKLSEEYMKITSSSTLTWAIIKSPRARRMTQYRKYVWHKPEDLSLDLYNVKLATVAYTYNSSKMKGQTPLDQESATWYM